MNQWKIHSHTPVWMDDHLLDFIINNEENFGPLNPSIGTEGGYLIQYLPLLYDGYAVKSTIVYLLDLYHRRTGNHDPKILRNFIDIHAYEIDPLQIQNAQLQARLLLEYEIVKGAFDKYILS